MSEQKMGLVPRLRFPEFREAGEWEVEQLGDVADFAKGKGLPKSALIPDGANECIHYGELFTEYPEVIGAIKSRTNLDGDVVVSQKNDILMPTSDVTPTGLAKACCITQSGVILGGDILIIRPKRSDVRGEFLSRYIRHLEQKVLQYVTGSTVYHLYAASIAKLAVSFPRGKEQQKIADCLSSLDALIAAQADKLDALKTHKKGLMQQLFPREGETVPRLRFPEFREAGEWEAKTLGDLSTIVRGGSPRPIDGFLTKAANGLNWLKIGDVDKEAKYVTKTEEKVRPEALSKTREVNPGDLILSNSMSFGRPYLMKIKSCIHDGWIAITKIDDFISREYLYYLIFSSASQSYFINNAAGSGVLNLNAEIIRSLPAVYPSAAEQQKIAACLSSLDDLITAQTEKLEALRTHKKGLMQRLFPSPDAVAA